MDTTKQTRQIIVRLLNNLGSQKEVQQYLKRFSALETEKFAVVKVGGETLQQDITALSVARRARLGLGRSFQISAVIPEYSARRNVMLALQSLKPVPSEALSEARTAE